MLAAMMVAWGLVLLLPMRTFEMPIYSYLAAIADEEVWGAFSVAVGGFRMAALYVNGAWRRTPLIRAAGAVLGMVWWIVLALLVFLAAEQGIGHFPAGAAFYPVCLAFEALSCWRAGFDAHDQGALRKAGARR
jgi:hypothetical protein